ncbi:protein YIPF6 isoform X2 [Narcine bancroftii]|uniref:protein YIPF6 isoform X2 n=1 Tax=Narcine bancroftii TaxID=1343680 RepID=UPI003831E26E
MSAGLKMAEVESEAKQPLFSDLADVSISNDVPVEGQITVPVDTHSQEDDYSTLDEPVKDTIMRDLKAVGKKFVHVMYPRKSSTLLRDWDLWGPLVLCVLLAMLLQGNSVENKHDSGPQFAEVFVIVWFGAVVITLNSKLLGGTMHSLLKLAAELFHGIKLVILQQTFLSMETKLPCKIKIPGMIPIPYIVTPGLLYVCIQSLWIS